MTIIQPADVAAYFGAKVPEHGPLERLHYFSLLAATAQTDKQARQWWQSLPATTVRERFEEALVAQRPAVAANTAYAAKLHLPHLLAIPPLGYAHLLGQLAKRVTAISDEDIRSGRDGDWYTERLRRAVVGVAAREVLSGIATDVFTEVAGRAIGAADDTTYMSLRAASYGVPYLQPVWHGFDASYYAKSGECEVLVAYRPLYQDLYVVAERKRFSIEEAFATSTNGHALFLAAAGLKVLGGIPQARDAARLALRTARDAFGNNNGNLATTDVRRIAFALRYTEGVSTSVAPSLPGSFAVRSALQRPGDSLRVS